MDYSNIIDWMVEGLNFTSKYGNACFLQGIMVLDDHTPCRRSHHAQEWQRSSLMNFLITTASQPWQPLTFLWYYFSGGKSTRLLTLARFPVQLPRGGWDVARRPGTSRALRRDECQERTVCWQPFLLCMGDMRWGEEKFRVWWGVFVCSSEKKKKRSALLVFI